MKLTSLKAEMKAVYCIYISIYVHILKLLCCIVDFIFWWPVVSYQMTLFYNINVGYVFLTLVHMLHEFICHILPAMNAFLYIADDSL